MKKNKNFIVTIVIISCIIMGVVDAIIQPNYFIKSFIKLLLFLLLPSIYFLKVDKTELVRLLKIDFKGIVVNILLGIIIYVIIVGGYFVLRNVIDLSNVTTSLTKNIGVNKNNFIFVALYISFINSFVEEFFFRGFAFLILMKLTKKVNAYIFSSICFALYHVAMMIGWFDIKVFMLALIGTFVGGLIFNYLNYKHKNIYASWTVHMFANFAINTIGFILFSV